MQESFATEALQSEWFSHSYFKNSHRQPSQPSDDEEEEVESRFRGMPHAVAIKQAASFPEIAHQPSRVAARKLQVKNELASKAAAAHPKLSQSPPPIMKEAPKQRHMGARGLTDHSKESPGNWLGNLRHRKRACPFASSKGKQASSPPSTSKKHNPKAAGKDKPHQVLATLPSMLCISASKKRPLNTMNALPPDESFLANGNEGGHEASANEMEIVSEESPQAASACSDLWKAPASQQDASAILMAGKLNTRLVCLMSFPA